MNSYNPFNSFIPDFLRRKRDRTPENSETIPLVKAPTAQNGQVATSSSGEVEEGDIFSQLDTFKRETGVKKEKLFDHVSWWSCPGRFSLRMRRANHCDSTSSRKTAQILHSEIQDLPSKAQQARAPNLWLASGRSYPADEVFRKASERADQEYFGAR